MAVSSVMVNRKFTISIKETMVTNTYAKDPRTNNPTRMVCIYHMVAVINVSYAVLAKSCWYQWRMKPNCNLDHPLNKVRRLSTQRQMHKAITDFKSLHGFTTTYLSDQFPNRTDVTSYSLRDSVNKLAVSLPRKQF